MNEPPAAPRRHIYIRVALTLFLMVGVFGLTFWLGARSAPHRSLAVLPFVDLGERAANPPIADGLSEALIGRLTRIPGLRVLPSESTFPFKNKPAPPREIARALQVTLILDGSVRRTGDGVTVAARLIRAGDSAVVWSRSYDRPWSNPPAIQDDIAGVITKDLEKILLSGG